MKKLLTIFMAAMIFLSVMPASARDEASLLAVYEPSISVSDVINGKEVRITSRTSGSQIYYTLNGTTPNQNSTPYTDTFVIEEAGNYKIRAIAYKNGEASSVASSDFTLQSCGFDTGQSSDNMLRISYVSSGRYRVQFLNFSGYTVYYTTGHITRPTTSSTNINSGTLYITKPTYINLLICRKGYAPVRLTLYATQDAWKNTPTVADITAGRQSFYGGKNVVLSTETEDATIYYRIAQSRFNSDVTTSDIKYTGPFTIQNEGVYYIKAFAVKDGYFDSDQSSLMTVTVEKCDEPKVTISNVSGSSRKRVTATVSDDSEIYYTVDGTTPNENSIKYTSARTLGENYDLRFIAVKRGNVSSNVVRASVKASGGDELEVRSSTAENGAKTITISSLDENAQIYYALTSSGSTDYYPVQGRDSLYTGPIVINKTSDQYIWARALIDGTYGPLFKAHIVVNMETLDMRTETLPIGIKAVTLTAPKSSEVYYVISSKAGEVEDVLGNGNNVLYTYPITVTESSYITAIELDKDGNELNRLYRYIDIPNGPLTPDKVGDISVQSDTFNGVVSVTMDSGDSNVDFFYVFDENSSTAATTRDTMYTRGETLSFDKDGYLHVLAARPGYEPRIETYEIYAGEKTAAAVITYTSSGGMCIVRFSCDTPGAKFYYTTNGTNPTVHSDEAAEGMAVVDENVTLKAIAKADGYAPSDVTTEILMSGNPDKCRSIIYEQGDVIGGKVIQLTCLTGGAKIYYTTNGSQPSTNSLLYNDTDMIRVTTEGKTRIRAIAVKSGYMDSDVLELDVTLTRLAPPSVQTSDLGGSKAILMNASEGASIYYTLDGSLPAINDEGTVAGTSISTGMFYIDETSIVTAVAAANGYVSSYLYRSTISVDDNAVSVPRTDNLTHTPVMGGEELAITCNTEGASIYYSLDPGNLSEVTPDILYTGPIFIGAPSTKVTVIAKKAGMRDSSKVRFTIPLDKAPVPVASIESNSIVKAGTKVGLSVDGVENVEYSIFYTTDGTAPTIESQVYTSPIEITGDMRIRAIAAGIGVAASDILELYYMVDDGEDRALIIDAAGLVKDDNLITGSINVLVNGVDLAGRRVVAAMYSDDELICVMSRDDADGLNEVEFSGIDVLTETESGVVIKAFVLEGDGVTPVCRSATYIEV